MKTRDEIIEMISSARFEFDCKYKKDAENLLSQEIEKWEFEIKSGNLLEYWTIPFDKSEYFLNSVISVANSYGYTVETGSNYIILKLR